MCGQITAYFHKQKTPWHMSTDWIIALSATAGTVMGGIVTALIHAFSKNSVTTLTDISQFRKDILTRIESLEKKQETLQIEVDKWKNWYWDLYYWLVRFVMHHKIDVEVPKFHEGYQPPNKGKHET